MTAQEEDRKVLNTLLMVVGSLIAFFIFSIIAARMVSATAEKSAVDPMVESAIIDRIKPFGELNVGTAPVAAAPAAVDAKASFKASCFACHGTGAAGAPKFGDKAAWKKRIAQGLDTLFSHAINGFKGMPPKGGSSLSDDAVKAIVKYMVKNSK